MKENKKGISLIVLVITIIVMIILASTVIISLTGNSVIDRAKDAVQSTNLSTMQDLAQTIWAEAYLDGAREQDEFEEAITKGLAGYDTTNYTITVTTDGVTVEMKKLLWVKDGFTVTNGVQTLNIGDVVHYDETAGGTKSFSRDIQWQVLGADEDGNLLILSTTGIGSLGLGDSTYGSNFAKAQSDWLNGETELNRLCEPYGYGKNVVGKARSITIEDIDNVTGYDKTTYATGESHQYGNEVTFSYNGTTKPSYTSAAASGALTSAHSNGFYYYDGKEYKVANDLTTKSSGEIITITSTGYEYTPSEECEIIDKVYTMLFNVGDYWLASRYIDVYDFAVEYGMQCVWINDTCYVGKYYMWESSGYTYYQNFNVRAVVTLSSDITFTGNSTDGWDY